MPERDRTERGACGLQGKQERKQNSRRKGTSYLDTAARICRLVLEASSYMFSVPRKGRNGYLCQTQTCL